MSQMMVQVFSLLCFFIHKKLKMILSVCAALITINDNSCYLIVNFFPAQMEVVNSKLLLCFWLCCFVVLSGIG